MLHQYKLIQKNLLKTIAPFRYLNTEFNQFTAFFGNFFLSHTTILGHKVTNYPNILPVSYLEKLLTPVILGELNLSSKFPDMYVICEYIWPYRELFWSLWP